MSIKNLDFFANRKRLAPDWIISGFLKRGGVGFIQGEPKLSCKSWILLNGAWNLSEGKPFLPITHTKNKQILTPPYPLRIVYFTQEDTDDDLHDRLEIMQKGGKRTPNKRLFFVTKDLSRTLDKKSGVQSFLNELDSIASNFGPIDLIILDPMRRIHGQDENDSTVIQAFWSVLDIFRRKYNCSFMIAHHIKKPQGKDVWFDLTSPNMMRGSSDIYAGGDAFIMVAPRRTAGNPNLFRRLDLHFQSKRGKGIAPVTVDVNFNTGGVEFRNFVTGRKSIMEEDNIPSMTGR